jgi:hypothetical protein
VTAEAKREEQRSCRTCSATFIIRHPHTGQYPKYCGARCRYRWRKRPRVLLRRNDIMPANDVVAPTRWRIVRELAPRDGEDMALCRCARGHMQTIAVDLRPAPDCERCQQDISDLPEVRRLTAQYWQRLKKSRPAGRGRKSQYEPYTGATLCGLVHFGMALCEACSVLDLSPVTVYGWYYGGLKGRTRFKLFSEAVMSARRARRTRRRT